MQTTTEVLLITLGVLLLAAVIRQAVRWYFHEKLKYLRKTMNLIQSDENEKEAK